VKTVIKVEHLGKRYLIGSPEQSPDTLRETVVHALKSPLRRLAELRRPHSDKEDSSFWALKDVTFDVKQGDVVGIIGRNGAGKSTLLKILSKITEPTRGDIYLKGRVASLLDVGTGFHPELTGRENIYLNGAILGMSRLEISRKFDAIVEFSETDKFLDTPVKRYSSGMYVRLAFAIAAHLEPEILIVDEVLAVGDVQFQKKSLGKMQDISHGGRTVLFVSHNMGAVRNLCNRGILLRNGQCVAIGSSAEVVDEYLQLTLTSMDTMSIADRPRINPPKGIKITDVQIVNRRSGLKGEAETHDDLEIIISYEVIGSVSYFAAEWMFRDNNGGYLAHSSSSPMGDVLYHPTGTAGQVRCTLAKVPFTIGQYRLDVGLAVPNVEYLDYVEDACILAISSCDPGKTGNQLRCEKAPVYIGGEWSTN